MTKRYSLRINAKDKGVKIFDNVDDDNWRVLNLHFNNYEDTQFVKSKLIPVVALLNDFAEDNEQLKQQLSDCKKDEEQLGISFMEYKMQLIDVLQQNYNYAYNQRQKNLDKSIVARAYEVLAYTVYNIAETMNVDIERFPKGDVE